jgi:hypothetical protein
LRTFLLLSLEATAFLLRGIIFCFLNGGGFFALYYQRLG